jgi:hypothetical protein
LLGCTCILSSHVLLLSIFVDFTGYIFRLLPVPGRLYVSTNYFCFKSTGPLSSKTRVCNS